MPELPEVETVRQQLLPLVKDRRITDVTVRAAKLLQNCDPEIFRGILSGRSITNIDRRGKYLIFDCGDAFAIFHLGMSGIFLNDRSRSRHPQHIHVDIEFDDHSAIYFQDVRKFGKIWLHDAYPQIPGLGIDPIAETISQAKFAELLASTSKNIKLFPMDQGYIAGIGNIYASEMLFTARISPYRKTDQLSPAEVAALYREMHAILQSAIENYGTTYSAYQTVDGASGDNQNFLKVYQLEGQPCSNCGSPIIKTILGSRSTFYCEECQA